MTTYLRLVFSTKSTIARVGHLTRSIKNDVFREWGRRSGGLRDYGLTRNTPPAAFKLNGNGFTKVRDYDLGFWFTAQTFEAQDLPQLAGCIELLREYRNRVIVRGDLDDLYYERIGLNPDYRLTRRKNDKKDGLAPHLREASRQWGMFDVDGYPLRPDDNLAIDPGPVIDRCVRDILPVEFHDATIYWQLSSSAGLVEGVLKCHLWVWFDRPYKTRICVAG